MTYVHIYRVVYLAVCCSRYITPPGVRGELNLVVVNVVVVVRRWNVRGVVWGGTGVVVIRAKVVGCVVQNVHVGIAHVEDAVLVRHVGDVHNMTLITKMDCAISCFAAKIAVGGSLVRAVSGLASFARRICLARGWSYAWIACGLVGINDVKEDATVRELVLMEGIHLGLGPGDARGASQEVVFGSNVVVGSTTCNGKVAIYIGIAFVIVHVARALGDAWLGGRR